MLTRLFSRAALLAATSTLALGLAHAASAQDLYAADISGGNIFKYTPGGVKTTFASGLLEADSLAFDSSGNLYVGSHAPNTSIFKFTPGGIGSAFATGLSYANGLAFDTSGNLFAADSLGNAIYKFTPGGVKS